MARPADTTDVLTTALFLLVGILVLAAYDLTDLKSLQRRVGQLEQQLLRLEGRQVER